MNPLVHSFFDPVTYTVTHVVADPETRDAAIVDSVMDYDPNSGRLFSKQADALIAFVKEQNYRITHILETHAHADHVSAAPYLKKALGGDIGIGEHILDVQTVFRDVFHLPESEVHQTVFDHLWKDGETFLLGTIPVRVIHTSGHTPADVTYHIGDGLFVGDTLFMPDYGTARCDFPGGSAETLYASIQKLFTFPEETRVFLCHDYLPAGRTEYQWETTVGEQKRSNIHVGQGVSKETFTHMRTTRDQTLDVPRLIIPSIQLNIRGGNLPTPEENSVSYLKIPINGAFAHIQTHT